MLKIRLHRTGKTKRPFFRVVVAEHRRAAQGPYLTSLGFWDPIKADLKLDEKQLKLWMDRGAKPSDRIARLLKKRGITHKHIVIREKPARGPKSQEPAPEKALSAVAEAPAPEEAAQVAAEQAQSAQGASAAEQTDTGNDASPPHQETPPAVEGETQENQTQSS